MAPRARTLSVALLAAIPHGCGGPAPSPPTLRLVDLYRPETLTGHAASAAVRPRTEWRFDRPPDASLPKALAATRGFEGGPGIEGLAVRDGRLVGKTGTTSAILHVERPADREADDIVERVEIRARIAGGGELALTYRETPKVDLAEIAGRMHELPWKTRTPVLAGNEVRSYTFDLKRLPVTLLSSKLRHLLLQPSSVAGARFEIESVRLVFRKEHLAGVASGVGWQGLSEVYRETLVARSPETIHVRLRLPPRPQLDLAIGTIEDVPVTFRVVARSGDDERRLLERTLTTPNRWEEVPLELPALAGRDVTLELSLASAAPGALGFWGSPTIRSHGTMPRPETAADAPAARPQGVILIWADTLRRDHLDVYGYERPTAPVVRRMAGEGVLFRDCVGQATWTKVATPSLLTSLYPTSHGVLDFSDRLPASATTLAEVFRRAGYATLSLSSVLFTGRFTNLHRGFEVVHEDSSLPDLDSSKTARLYVDRLLPWLDAHRDVPFFVFLHVADPHDPYRPPPPYDKMWGDASRFEEHERQAKEVKKFITTPLLKLFGMPSRAELRKAGFDPDAYATVDQGFYDGAIRGMDTEIGRVLERLQALGLGGKTLVAFTADHGEEFLEHGRMFHGQSTYGELANLPLVLWQPGALPGGAVVENTVATIDLMPTLLQLSRLPIPPAAQGRSLVPLLFPAGRKAGGAEAADGGWPDRPAITEKNITHEPVGAPEPMDTADFSIVFRGYKLVHHASRPAGGPEYELFDHRRDRLDQTDIAASHPEVVAELSRELAAWRKTAEAARLKPDAASTASMSPEQLDRLRALGYIQ
jgi:arylsulfatase A-like enzyme